MNGLECARGLVAGDCDCDCGKLVFELDNELAGEFVLP